MEKKLYIKPSIKGLQLNAKYYLAAGSDPLSNEWNSRQEKDTSIWDTDEEEEEDNLGGWFK